MAWNETDFTLTCEASGVVHAVRVDVPHRYDSIEGAPLVLCLDGAWTAGTVRDATRVMSMSREAPEAVVVSLSFTDEKMSDYVASRAKWYCPTQWTPPRMTGVKDIPAEELGHASVLLGFLRDQLLPRLQADFAFGERWIIGHSFSGLFGLYTLFHEPSLFDKYLLASPSIWWDDRVMLDIEAAYAESHDDLPARVFLTAGEQEIDEYAILANMIEMSTRLRGRGYPSLEVEHAILPTESHSSTIGAAVSRGVRRLHESAAPTPEG